ncbi:MAG: flagellar motor protein MotB [Thiohalophilus sp.]|uniref:flagellar motor protein MotB n=1 Tax=Thiohalophilus sp. TaxID=3028392 RepID=UPI00287067AF|nr:flagellar motor protein MotB [Thiohalophilus sp.]MDR9436669.1 flagellar motor protein MotB [Thiohalophilus sp.]
MAAEDKKQPIVIKKVVKKGGGHHGGSWKVAYADFVTAMMAFFLLLWLLGISDDALREGISDWFQNPSAIQGPGGASTSMIKLGGTKDIPKGEGRKSEQHAPQVDPVEQTEQENIKERVREVIRQQDKKQLDQLLQKLKAAIESSDQLKNFKDQLLLEITPEGLRVQIVDKKNRPMFDLGSDQLKSYTREILQNISQVIAANVPNKVSIAGHTDATPFPKGYIEYEDQYGNDYRKPYSNWELSADRANAARRELVEGGMPSEQLGRVVGLADSVLFDKENPYNPVNRRISIVVLNRDAEQALMEGEGKMDTLEIKPDQPASE